MSILHKTLLLVFFSACFSRVVAQSVQPSLNKPNMTATPPQSAVTSFPYLSNYTTNYNLRNFCRVFTPQAATTYPTDISLSASANAPSMAVTSYFDYLGRPIQEVRKLGASTLFKDFVTVHAYDELGRESIIYKPYSYSDITSNVGKFKKTCLSQLQNQYNSLHIGEHPYTKLEFDNSPLNKTTKVNPPGSSWVGASLGKTISEVSNLNTDADRIIKYSIDYTGIDDLPIRSGFYGIGKLNAKSVTDEDGNTQTTYTDFFGKTIAILDVQPLTGVSTTWRNQYHITYYVYDDAGKLRLTITPEAYKQNAGTISATVADKYCYKYWYDEKGRIVKQKQPGKEVEYYVYDRKGRLALSQDGNLRHDQNKWNFTVYDCMDRDLISGIALNGATQAEWVTFFATANVSSYTNQNLKYFLLKQNLYHEYENAFITDADIYIKNFYDDYSYPEMANSEFETSTLSSLTGTLPYAETPEQSLQTKGLLTGSKVLVMDGTFTHFIQTINYYDKKAQLIQRQKTNQKGITDIVTNQYDFAGSLVSSVIVHGELTPIPGTSPPLYPSTRVVKKFTKDYNTGVTYKLEQNINNTGFRILYSLGYDDLNRIASKDLTPTNIEYSYNVRNWLTGINKQYINKNQVGTMPSNVFFAEELSYNNGFASKLYNGNIAGIKWRTYGTNATTRAYGYTYDNLNRLNYAQFNELLNTGTWLWQIGGNDFTTSGVTYDNNGNIKTLNQKAPGNPSPVDMDLMEYSYNGNLLLGIKDNASAFTASPDFKDDANHSLADYTYDYNGNLKTDLNKGILTPIGYNYLNKPQHIVISNKGTIDYLYDAQGNKLKETVFDQVAGTTKTIDYLDDFVYEDNQLQYIQNEEGRCRPILSTQNGQNAFFYDYYIKDHLGNIRSVVNSEVTGIGPAVEYTASMEISLANTESLVWSHLDDVREGKPLSTDPEDTRAAQLDGTYPNKSIGTAIMLRVMPGDRFSLSAQSFYGDVWKETSAGTATEAQIVSALTNALLGGETYEGVPVEGLPENVHIIQNTVGASQFTGTYSNITDQNSDPDYPKSYLNYMLFDNHNRLVRDQSDVIQMGGPQGQWNINGTNGIIEVGQPGYLLVFCSNQTKTPVFWDAVDVVFYKGNLLEENHYYPFGLTVSSLSANPNERNDMKFQSQKLENGLGINMYSFKWREHDPQTGRFWQIDPLANNYTHNTPYAFCENKVTSFVELEGLEAEIFDYNNNATGDGTGVLDTRMSLGQNEFGYGNTGIYINTRDELSGMTGGWYVPDAVVTASKLDNRSLNDQFGDWAGSKVNRFITPSFDRFDTRMRAASDVSFGISFGVKLNQSVYEAGVGMYSPDENTFGFEVKASSAMDAKTKFSSDKGLESTLNNFIPKPSIDIKFSINDALVASGIKNKVDPYVQVGAGPVTVKSNSITISLLKADWKFNTSAGAGVVNKVESTFRSPIYSTKPIFVK